MMGNLFRRSNVYKKIVHKEQYAEIESDASSGGQGKYITYLSFQRLPAEATLTIFNFIIY
jgi:hypothetical protein